MLTKKPQAISGVSSTYENVIDEAYPSLGVTGFGRFLNALYESIPVGVGEVKLSYLIFVPLTLPFALLGYFLVKIGGSKYVVTNRGVKRTTFLGGRLLEEAPLSAIEQVTVDPDSRLAFFRSGDIRLTNAAGDTLLLLRGVQYPDRLVQVILEIRDARRFTEASLVTIRARK